MNQDFDRMLGAVLETELGIPEDERGGAVQSGTVQGEPSLDPVERLLRRPIKLGREPVTSGDVQGAPTTHRILPEGFDAMPAVAGYEVLSAILATAYQQAATGKGRERHSTGPLGFQPWHLQPIMSIGRQVGPGGHAYQIAKKAQESVTMQGNGNYEGAKAEALGAIIYAAALYRLYQEMEAANGGAG